MKKILLQTFSASTDTKQNTLRLAVKAISDTHGTNSISLSEMVSGVARAHLVSSETKVQQTEQFKALEDERNEMARITAENWINDVLRRKLRPFTKYRISAGGKARVYCEKYCT